MLPQTKPLATGAFWRQFRIFGAGTELRNFTITPHSRLVAMEGKKQEDCISENLVPHLHQFVESLYFREKIEDFLHQVSPVFGNESKVEEYTLSQTEAFDSYQSLIEHLFHQFAYKHGYSISLIYECCRDVRKSLAVPNANNSDSSAAEEGKYAPLFQEDENFWMLESILSFLDFCEFVKLVRRYQHRKFDEGKTNWK